MSKENSDLPLLLEEIDEDLENDEDLNSNLIDDEISSVVRGYQLSLPQNKAISLYNTAGTEEDEIKNEMTVYPSPHALSTAEEQLIFEVKEELGVPFDLDSFQVQSLVALLNGRNVVLVAPCGSGKLLVFYMGVKLLRIKYNLPKGIGVCLQPLNNILWEGFITWSFIYCKTKTCSFINQK